MMNLRPPAVAALRGPLALEASMSGSAGGAAIGGGANLVSSGAAGNTALASGHVFNLVFCALVGTAAVVARSAQRERVRHVARRARAVGRSGYGFGEPLRGRCQCCPPRTTRADGPTSCAPSPPAAKRQEIGLCPDRDAYDWYSHWYPVHIVENMDPARPHTTQLLGMDLVIWMACPDVDGEHQLGSWRVSRDACTQCQGPLRAWRVGSDGDLVCSCGSRYGDRTLGGTSDFPTKVADGLLFVFPQTGPEAFDNAAKVEVCVLAELKDPAWEKRYVKIIPAGVRDFPCGWDTMAENTLDPAHFCSAHHNTLGNRYTDPAAFTFRPKENMTAESGLGLRGDMGVVEFRPPCLVRYLPDYAGMPFQGSLVIGTYCVPTRPGWVRPLAVVLQDKDTGTDATLAVRALSVFMGPVPVWFQHVMAPIVVHQDCGLLYYQHRNLHDNGYRPRQDGSIPFEKLVHCPSTVDRGVTTFRRWLREHGGDGIPWACDDVLDAKDSVDIYDTWNAHTKNCQHCMVAYRNLQALKGVCIGLSSSAAFFLPEGVERIEVAGAAALLAMGIHQFTGLFVRYETNHADNGAAIFR